MTTRHEYRPQYTNVYEILTAAGYRFSLDFDDEVLVESPEQLDRDGIDKVMQKAMYSIQCRLRSDRRVDQQVFVGGPLAGQRHGDQVRLDGKMFVKLGPKRWACYGKPIVKLAGIGYVPADDPRLFFLGIASSQRNAKLGQYIEAPR
jgi:hypothetical protein